MKKRGLAPRPLTPHQQKVLDVISKNPDLTGLEYCRALDAAKVFVQDE